MSSPGPNDGAAEPVDPMTQLAEGAASAHEMYSAYVAAGFDKREAIYLVASIITATLRGGPAQP